MKRYDPVHDTPTAGPSSSSNNLSQKSHRESSSIDGMTHSKVGAAPSSASGRSSTAAAALHISHHVDDAATAGATEASPYVGVCRESQDADKAASQAPRVNIDAQVHRVRQMSSYIACDGIPEMPEAHIITTSDPAAMHHQPEDILREQLCDMTTCERASGAALSSSSPSSAQSHHSSGDIMPSTTPFITTSRVPTLPSVSSIVASLKHSEAFYPHHFSSVLAPQPTASSSSTRLQNLQHARRSQTDGFIHSPFTPFTTHDASIAADRRRSSLGTLHPPESTSSSQVPSSSVTASSEIFSSKSSIASRRAATSVVEPSTSPSTSQIRARAAAQPQQVEPQSSTSMPKKREHDEVPDASGAKVKKKRIQQACKVCGVKRVKCDGGNPCSTCIRSGETCEYGQPKKRGPPKGSVRNRSAAQKVNVTANNYSTGAMSQARFADRVYYPGDDSRSASPRGGSDAFHRSSGTNTRQASPVSSYSASQGLLALGTPALQPVPHPMGVGSVFSLYASREDDGEARYSINQHHSQQQQQLQPQHHPHQHHHHQLPTGAVGPRNEFHQPTYSPLTARDDTSAFARMQDTHSPSLTAGRPLHCTPANAQQAFEHALPMPVPMPEMSKPLADSSAAATPVIVRRPGSLSGPAGWRPDMGPSPRSGLTSPSGFSLQHLPAPSVSTPSESAERSRDDTGVEWSEASFADRALATFWRERKRASSIMDKNGRVPPEQLRREQLTAAAAERERTSSPDADDIPSIALVDPCIPSFVYDRLWLLIHKVILPHWGAIDSTKRVDEEAQPLLFNALCALAAASWDPDADAPLADVADEHGRQQPYLSGKELCSIFFVRARYYLLRANNESSHELIAALIYMSLYEGGAGRLDASAQFCGMASRACLDLGLHRSLALGKEVTPQEDQARRRLFWTAYVLDQYISAQLGKPPNLREIEADCPYPVCEERDHTEEYQTWTHDMVHLLPNKKVMDRLCTFPLHAVSSLIFEAKLATCCEAIIAQYNVVKSKVDPLTRLESTEQTLLRLHRRVMQWHEERPDFLRWEDPSRLPLPHILCQNLWHATCLIILHRPHIMHTKRAASKEMLSSHAVCTKAAATVCSIVSRHEELYGMRKLSSTTVYCLFTASTISVANTTSSDPHVAAQAKEQLRKAFRWLSRISKVWRSAAHHLRVLQRLGNGIDADLAGTGLEATLHNRKDCQSESEVEQPQLSVTPSSATLGASVPALALAPAPAPAPAMQPIEPAYTMAYPSQTQSTYDGIPMVAEQQQQPHADMSIPLQQSERFVSSYPHPMEWNYGTGNFNSAPASAAIPRADSLADPAASLAAADAYWSCMPLASEDSRSWETFASSYLSAFAQLNAPSKTVIPAAPVVLSPTHSALNYSPSQPFMTSPPNVAPGTSNSTHDDRVNVRWATDRSTLEGA